MKVSPTAYMSRIGWDWTAVGIPSAVTSGRTRGRSPGPFAILSRCCHRRASVRLIARSNSDNAGFVRCKDRPDVHAADVQGDSKLDRLVTGLVGGVPHVEPSMRSILSLEDPPIEDGSPC